MNIQTAIQKAQLFLKKKNTKTPVLDSQILMSEAIKKEKEFIILNFDKEISNKSLEYFNKLINQRGKGEPIAYLVKKKYFWKYKFTVNRDVLIPRPDTEVLIEEVLKWKPNHNLKMFTRQFEIVSPQLPRQTHHFIQTARRGVCESQRCSLRFLSLLIAEHGFRPTFSCDGGVNRLTHGLIISFHRNAGLTSMANVGCPAMMPIYQ